MKFKLSFALSLLLLSLVSVKNAQAQQGVTILVPINNAGTVRFFCDAFNSYDVGPGQIVDCPNTGWRWQNINGTMTFVGLTPRPAINVIVLPPIQQQQPQPGGIYYYYPPQNFGGWYTTTTTWSFGY